MTTVNKEKLANVIVFFAERLRDVSKTKLLKLLYILEEYYVKKYRIPMLDIDFEVWQAGPVNKEVYIELNEDPVIFKDYIETARLNESTVVRPLRPFSDEEFSDNEISMMEFVLENFGGMTANALVDLLHKPLTPWHTIAQEKGLLDAFEKKQINTSEERIPLDRFFCTEPQCQERYREQQEFNRMLRHYAV